LTISRLNQNISGILQNSNTIAVVGISDKPHRPSHQIALYLKQAGYTLFPVNPNYETVLGMPCYKQLQDIPHPVDIVDVFRRPEEVLTIAEQAIAIGAKVLWLQSGIINQEAARLAQQAGLQVVMDRCIKVEHRLLGLG